MYIFKVQLLSAFNRFTLNKVLMTANKYIAIAVKSKSGKITAFCHDFPGLIVQGDSMPDVQVKLKKLIDSFQQRISDMKNNLVIQPVIM